MDRAAKLARMGDRLISFIAMILVLGMMLYGGYSLLDNWRLSQAGFGSDLMKYKPAPGQSWSMAELVATNKDVIGWITIDDTHIDQPIVQGKDDMEYVNKDPLGEFSLSGSIFLSCLNSLDFSDPYSLMYGHHMENGGMFGDLTKFLKKDYFDDHKTGTLYSLDSQWDIEVFAVLKTDAAAQTYVHTRRGLRLLTDDSSTLQKRLPAVPRYRRKAGSADHCSFDLL